MLAGLYEDPSAITAGWSDNPVEFDHVLNRSSNGWAWGSTDIVPMFARKVYKFVNRSLNLILPILLKLI